MSDDKEATRLRFQQLFKQADIDNDGVVNGRDAAEFFRRLHLPDGFLKKVCVLSDVKRQGSLGESEFYTSLQLIFLCRLDFASSSDEAYIQDWKEILHLLLVNGVIFPVPPSRDKMLRIFEETVAKHGIVTGAQVRAIFGRSSLRQDLFKSLCDMFVMSETKIVDDDLFIRFGMAVQLLLHATAAARKGRSSGRSTPRAADYASAPARSGSRTPRTEAVQTPREGWSRPTPATPREESPAPAPAANGHAQSTPVAPASPRTESGTLVQAAVAKRSGELQQMETQLQQASVDLAGHQQQHGILEKQLATLNSSLDEKKAVYDSILMETEQVRAAIAELHKERQEAEALSQTLAQHTAEAQAALDKEKSTHSHLLNCTLKQAQTTIRERDLEIAKLRDAQGGAAVATSWAQQPPMGEPAPVTLGEPTPRSAAAVLQAEQQIAEASSVFSTGGWAGEDPFAPAAQPADPFSSDPFEPSALDQSAIPVLEEQRTGGSIISQSFARTAPLGLAGLHRDRDELSDTDTINTGFTAVSTDYGETPRQEFVSEAAMAQLGSSVTVEIESITMKGIRRLNRPFVTVCCVDAEGRMLTTEQATPTLSTTSDQPDTFLINRKFLVPVPDDAALAGSCALILKLRQLQKRTGAPNSRCWVPLELRDLLHQNGTKHVSLSLYQKPTDLKRKRMFPEGKQSKIVLQVTTPDTLGSEGSGGHQEESMDLSGFTPGGEAAPAEADLTSHREPTAEELERAVELFNEKPKKGLQYMTDNGFFRPPPHNLQDIVRFLMEPVGMSKYQIGQYLGTRGELPEQVLKAFVGSLDFSGKSFDNCIRLYFKEFFPPGEADPIYRMMETFGAHFAATHPGLFKSEDAPLVLAYAVLMLNTDLHNKSIKDKISVDQFVHNLRGCNNHDNIDRAFLVDIYDRIKANEIKMKDDNDYRGGRPAGRSWRPAVIKTLTEGAEFLKYGRAGSPHNRWVYLTPDLKFVCYASKFGKASEDQRIAVSTITRVVMGMETPVFARQVDDKEKEKLRQRCFSLDAGTRTLDLQCPGEIECKKFFDAYRFLVAGYLTD